VTERDLKKLTKKELVHLVWSMNSRQPIDTLKSNLAFQREKKIHCGECISIARKLGVK